MGNPSSKTQPILRIQPMGGVGEIGSNMTVFETEKEILIIDYGILFPFDDFYDINYLIVDTKSLNRTKKITIFISHGHEDHIGAIQHLVQELPDAELYAPNFARQLIRKKLDDRKISKNIKVYRENDVIEFDTFDVHPIHVTHSIPETFGILIKSKDGKLATLFISDFKYDLNPLYEKPFNVQKIKDLFKGTHKRICMLDSTNVLKPEGSISESELTDGFDQILAKDKRTFITLFSSNIHRLKTIIEATKKQNRFIVTVGRSIQSYLAAAEAANLIDLADCPIKDITEITNFNDKRIVALLTGCQGDHMGALRRVTVGDHKQFKLNDQDQVVFSSKPIPGNEAKIYKIYNQISEQGAEIITHQEALIHASGHPGRADLEQLINEIDPTDYVPIHGESYFLKIHHEWIQKNFKFKSHLLGNFDSIDIYRDLSFKITQVEVDLPIIIHGKDIELERERISERRKIACNGAVFISIDKKKQDMTITYKGLPMAVDDKLEDIIGLLKGVAFNENRNKDDEIVAEKVRIKCRNIYKNFIGYKPITMVHCI